MSIPISTNSAIFITQENGFLKPTTCWCPPNLLYPTSLLHFLSHTDYRSSCPVLRNQNGCLQIYWFTNDKKGHSGTHRHNTFTPLLYYYFLTLNADHSWNASSSHYLNYFTLNHQIYFTQPVTQLINVCTILHPVSPLITILPSGVSVTVSPWTGSQIADVTGSSWIAGDCVKSTVSQSTLGEKPL